MLSPIIPKGVTTWNDGTVSTAARYVENLNNPMGAIYYNFVDERYIPTKNNLKTTQTNKSALVRYTITFNNPTKISQLRLASLNNDSSSNKKPLNIFFTMNTKNESRNYIIDENTEIDNNGNYMINVAEEEYTSILCTFYFDLNNFPVGSYVIASAVILFADVPVQPDKGINSTFYINSSAENVLNKSLTEIKSVKYQVWEPFDILHPTLTVRRDDALLDCNYVYIPKFNRYYFATIQVQKGNEMIVSCDIDPLESWKTRGLLDLSVPVIRQENKYNMYITDSKMPFLAKGEKQIVKITGGDNPFLESSQDTGEHFLLNSL